jgi:hypothetical protein
MLSPEERNSSKVRFFELLADTLTGDLKNNVTMTVDNGARTISGTLTESQIPELAKAFVDMAVERSGERYTYNDLGFEGDERVFEQINISNGVKTVTTRKQGVRPLTPEETEAWDKGRLYFNSGEQNYGIFVDDGDYYLNTSQEEIVSEYSAPATREDYPNDGSYDTLPLKDLTVNYLHGEAEIDADGNLLSVDFSGTATGIDIFDGVNTIEMNIYARFTDNGTSDPVCPMPGAEELLTPENMKARFGSSGYVGVYFTLNPDGSINADSITTKHPGEKY